MTDAICVDCEAAGRGNSRPVVATVKVGSRVKKASGKRCATDEREYQRARTATRKLQHRKRGFGLTDEQDERLLAFQDGVCWICRKATGAVKALAVDHDHSHCGGPTSCGLCVRGRLCGPCNQQLGRWDDDPRVFLRAALYLIAPVADFALARAQDEQGQWDWAWQPADYQRMVQEFVEAFVQQAVTTKTQIMSPVSLIPRQRTEADS